EDVGMAVAVDIAGPDRDAAASRERVGEEIGELQAVLTAEDANAGGATGPGAGDDIRETIAIHIARCDPRSVANRRLVGEEAADLVAIQPAEDLHVRAAG